MVVQVDCFHIDSEKCARSLALGWSTWAGRDVDQRVTSKRHLKVDTTVAEAVAGDEGVAA